MKTSDIEWRGGKVVYWDLDFLSPAMPLGRQVDSLKEDLAQVKFGKDIILDIGWYPEFSPNGRFVVSVVRDQDWDNPIARMECDSHNNLIDVIHKAIDIAIDPDSGYSL